MTIWNFTGFLILSLFYLTWMLHGDTINYAFHFWMYYIQGTQLHQAIFLLGFEINIYLFIKYPSFDSVSLVSCLCKIETRIVAYKKKYKCTFKHVSITNTIRMAL